MDSPLPARSANLFGEDSPDSRQRKAAAEVSQLLGEIAACRRILAGRETAALELDQRLHREMLPLEEQVRKTRIDTLRILAGHVRAGWLKNRSAAALTEVLNAFAHELEVAYGIDLSREMEGLREQASAGGLPERRRPAPAPEGTEGRRSGKIPGDAGAQALSNADRKRAAREEILAGDIRALYLLLARALHPDKESDPGRREAKTSWMQKVTTAYGDRDLARLLDILGQNPMDAVAPYLRKAPMKTVRGFAKRLRRDLTELRRRAAEFPENPEAAFARHLAEIRKDVKLLKARRDAYRHPEAIEALLDELREHDWRLLM
jgi:hypothetical protein